MKRHSIYVICGLLAAAAAAYTQGQQSDIVVRLTGGAKKVIALPDFRGAGGAAGLAGVFNATVFEDVQLSGVFTMAPKSFYPLNAPQQERDLRMPAAAQPQCGGLCLSDWAGAPVNADYLGFGYLGEQGGRLVAYGNFFNTRIEQPASARVFTKLYTGEMSEEGARKIAHEYAADILAQFGVPSLAGTKIYFVSDRQGKGTKEIWVMDFDGSNQRRITHFNSISTMPSISPDGRRLAFTTYAKGQPQIMMYSTETGRFIPFRNSAAPTNAQASFTPDGQHVLYASSVSGYMQIYIADLDGSNPRRLTATRAIEAEPKVNPKTGTEIAFVSGRGGLQQIYRMNMDGADIERLTNGEGEASNPAWHPEGRHLAFAWTRGYAPGNWNLFLMDVASRETVQLTHGEGRNENPSWAPDGRHLAFCSNRTGSYQIFTMLADGTGLRQLTSAGNNWMPVWSK
jgi:TolB protein